eukprot:1621627-Pyramimonas_sp.AAC.1
METGSIGSLSPRKLRVRGKCARSWKRSRRVHAYTLDKEMNDVMEHNDTTGPSAHAEPNFLSAYTSRIRLQRSMCKYTGAQADVEK